MSPAATASGAGIIQLGELAASQGLTVHGDKSLWLSHACALSPGEPGGLTFAENKRQARALSQSSASAAVVPADLLEDCSVSAIVTDQPRLMFARLIRAFVVEDTCPGIGAGAQIAAEAEVDAQARIEAGAVVGAGAVIGAGVVIGAGAVVGERVVIGRDCRIGPRACLLPGTRLGQRVVIGAGAVIGERGFGLVPGPSGLEAVPQLGGVTIADDVEIGANSTVDRGALEDTRIEAGAKIDNQVHIAHNCVIGAHTVIAGCTGIAGSCRIGAGCLIGGGVGIGDHVTIADGTTITAASQIPKNIETAGVYSSTFRAMPAATWRRRLALFRGLDRIEARLSRVEKNQRIAGEPNE